MDEWSSPFASLPPAKAQYRRADMVATCASKRSDSSAIHCYPTLCARPFHSLRSVYSSTVWRSVFLILFLNSNVFHMPIEKHLFRMSSQKEYCFFFYTSKSAVFSLLKVTRYTYRTGKGETICSSCIYRMRTIHIQICRKK